MRKSVVTLNAMLVIGALILVACGGSAPAPSGSSQGGQVVVGLITKTETNPFFVKMREGAQKEADAKGAKLMTAAGKFDNDNQSHGREFIYPKQEAILLAKGSSQPVLTTKTNSKTVDDTKNADLSRVSANGNETNVNANEKPQALAPTGASQQGEAAPVTIVIVARPRD